jgi:GalNAc-alpha-(1->4)-GalNAc-alpha-(1->3)-diNAcBac-PP-undecaprenol alpha-1,4-N-acetyl-D-galactosaminyltransferase
MIVCFAINSLNVGGAERVFVELANKVSEDRSYRVILFSLMKGDLSSEISPRVEHVCLNQKNPRAYVATLNFAVFLKQAKPNLVFSTLGMMGVSALLSRFFPKIKFISRLANTISADLQRVRLESPMKYIVQKFVYRMIFNSTPVVFQSNYMRDDCIKLNFKPRSYTVIYNPFVLSVAHVRYDYEFFTVGRYAWQKNYELLLNAFNQVKLSLPNARLGVVALGDPPEHIVKLVDSLKLRDDVDFLQDPTPFPKFSSRSIFVLSSRFEGMSNAMIEAVGHGYTTVSTRCPGGGTEVLGDIEYSLISENHSDSGALAESMLKMHWYNMNRSPIDFHNPPDTFFKRHDLEKIKDQYLDFFHDLRECD